MERPLCADQPQHPCPPVRGVAPASCPVLQGLVEAGWGTRRLLVLQRLTNTQNRKKRPFNTPQRSCSPACDRGRMLESLSSQHIWALSFSTDWPGVKVDAEWICCGFGFSLASRYDSWPLHSLPAFCFLTRMREGSLQGETTPPSLAGMPNVHVCLSLT